MKLVGTLVSPFVRKVYITMKQKNVKFVIDPVTAMYGNEVRSRLYEKVFHYGIYISFLLW
jgi:glutathione S-transferase